MEYLGACGPVVSSPGVGKGIITLAINFNLNLLQGKHSKQNIVNPKNISQLFKRTADRVSCVKEKKSLLRNFHVSKKGKTPRNMIIYSQLSNLYVKFRKNFIAIFTKTGYIYV